MTPKKGYYSLIQFCPDASRLEAVNVGIVLFCPEAKFLDARTSGNNQRAKQLVGNDFFEREALNAAKQSIERRLEVDRESFKDIKDLKTFIDTRGNLLKLTDPRSVKVFDPPADLERLYDELVGGLSVKNQKLGEKQLFPSLNETFEKLHGEGRAQLDLNVQVPIMGRSIRVPYAYQNGTLNLVKPYQFSRNENTSVDAAVRLGMEGNLLESHGMDESTEARLIIVSSFDKKSSSELMKRVEMLIGECKVENVTGDKVKEFIARVEKEAH